MGGGKTKKSRRVSLRVSGHHGKGLGLGEVNVSNGGEGNGCDRCGCLDEEACCPCFWTDKGVPPIWPLSWIFNPRNRYLNNNSVARKFGNLGFPFFDKERKAFMGVALALTVAAMITTVGCIALSDNNQFLYLTAFGVIYLTFFDKNGNEAGNVIFFGLSKFTTTECFNSTDENESHPRKPEQWSKCVLHDESWSQVQCDKDNSHSAWSDDSESYYGLDCDAMNRCRGTFLRSQFGAYLTTFTMIFALIGCLTRMRKVADTNFQKFIGCIPDTIGVLTQFLTLLEFMTNCYVKMPYVDSQGNKLSYESGAGFWSLVLCWFAALIRVIMHYCTPVPGGGVGCRFQDLMRDSIIDDRTLSLDFSNGVEMTSNSKPYALELQKKYNQSETDTQNVRHHFDSDSNSSLEGLPEKSSKTVTFFNSSYDLEGTEIVKTEGTTF